MLSRLDVMNNTAVKYKQDLIRLQEMVTETQQVVYIQFKQDQYSVYGCSSIDGHNFYTTGGYFSPQSL